MTARFCNWARGPMTVGLLMALAAAAGACGSSAATTTATPSPALTASTTPSIAPSLSPAPALKDLAGGRYFGTAVAVQQLDADPAYARSRPTSSAR